MRLILARFSVGAAAAFALSCGGSGGAPGAANPDASVPSAADGSAPGAPDADTFADADTDGSATGVTGSDASRAPGDAALTVEGGGGGADGAPAHRGPSNFDPSAIPVAGLGDVDIAPMDQCGIVFSVDCTSKRTYSTSSTQVTLANGKTAYVTAMKSLTIEAGGSLVVSDQWPAILYVLGPVDIEGAFSLDIASLTDPNAGAGQSPGPNFGAGGASFCGLGGAGANADGGPGGQPGPTYGTPQLIPLVTGSRGGGFTSSSQFPGGAIQITSTTSIVLGPKGYLLAGGEGGDYSRGANGGGGGSSGGAVLLEAPTVTIAGQVLVSGGSGGGNGSGSDGNGSGPAYGGPGGGGTGSYGTMLNGGAGAVVSPNVGGGGGGVGRIRINTSTGSATITGTLSPAVGTPCVTQGSF